MNKNGADKLNKYLSLSYTKRSGWIKRGFQVSESIFDHMYACYLIGLVLLPESLSNNDVYNKQTILNLLLIHDLGEKDIGDIIHGQKTEADRQNEFASIKSFLKGIEFGVAQDFESLWKTMESGTGTNINSTIAKEIDCIQSTYQFFKYLIEGKVTAKYATEDELLNWLNDINNSIIVSNVGRQIRNDLIIKNELFLNHNNDIKLLFLDFEKKNIS